MSPLMTKFKILQIAESIPFVQKSLDHNVVSNFAKLKGQFINRYEKLHAEQAILKSHLTEHKKTLNQILVKYFTSYLL